MKRIIINTRQLHEAVMTNQVVDNGDNLRNVINQAIKDGNSALGSDFAGVNIATEKDASVIGDESKSKNPVTISADAQDPKSIESAEKVADKNPGEVIVSVPNPVGNLMERRYSKKKIEEARLMAIRENGTVMTKAEMDRSFHKR